MQINSLTPHDACGFPLFSPNRSPPAYTSHCVENLTNLFRDSSCRFASDDSNTPQVLSISTYHEQNAEEDILASSKTLPLEALPLITLAAESSMIQASVSAERSR